MYHTPLVLPHNTKELASCSRSSEPWTSRGKQRYALHLAGARKLLDELEDLESSGAVSFNTHVHFAPGEFSEKSWVRALRGVADFTAFHCAVTHVDLPSPLLNTEAIMENPHWNLFEHLLHKNRRGTTEQKKAVAQWRGYTDTAQAGEVMPSRTALHPSLRPLGVARFHLGR